MLPDFQVAAISAVHSVFRFVPYHCGGAARNRNSHVGKRKKKGSLAEGV
jgi:hypothetical protein